jgi:trk system potassium uptake protein TrkA
MKDIKRQFAVIGLGRFGTSVAVTLQMLGHEVLAIDTDEEQVQKIAEHVTHVVQADTTDENALHALGLRNFDAVVVAIGADVQANVATTLLLKEMGIPYIVAKARNALHGKMLEKIGADRVVYPERDMGQRVAHSLISANVLDYIELSPELSLVEVTVPAVLAGKTLQQANMRALYGVNVVAIKRFDHLIVPPQPQEQIQESDILIVIGATDGIKRLENLV